MYVFISGLGAYEHTFTEQLLQDAAAACVLHWIPSCWFELLLCASAAGVGHYVHEAH